MDSRSAESRRWDTIYHLLYLAGLLALLGAEVGILRMPNPAGVAALVVIGLYGVIRLAELRIIRAIREQGGRR